MGGGHIVIGPPPPGVGSGQGFCRESMEGARYEAIRPLLEAQPYVRGVSWGTMPPGAVDVSDFRQGPHIQQNIIQSIARHLRIGKVSEEPWLTVPVPPDGLPFDGVVFARSPRYHNPRMNWSGYCDKYHDAVFVGLPSEHAAFEAATGHQVKYLITEDLLALAQVMAGAKRVLSNQTCSCWIAYGLGAPMVLEVCPDRNVQNSIIARDNVMFIGNQDQADGRQWH